MNSQSMMAVIKENPTYGINIKNVPIPKLQPDEVLVKVDATSICGTDVHIYEWNDWAQRRIKNLPQILGHEFCGKIVEVGSEVRNFKIGDYVSGETHIYCGFCKQCLSNQRHICANLSIFGVDRDGCFAEYTKIQERVLWRNSEDIPPEIACIQEPIGNSAYCTLVEPVTGKSVLIIGDGPTALFASSIAKLSGASLVVLIGINEYRLNIAKRMGADIVINGSNVDPTINLKNLTNNEGFDVVLEMVGIPKTIKLALSLISFGGRLSAFGISGDKVELLFPEEIIFKGIKIYGITGRLIWDTWLIVRNLLKNKKFDPSPVVTHILPLEKIKEGMEAILEQPTKVGKIVLKP